MQKLTELESILMVLYFKDKTNKGINRRHISTYVNMYRIIINEETPTNFYIYPDGLDDPDLNKSIDYLVYLGALTNKNGYISLTENGLKVAQEILEKICNNQCSELLKAIVNYSPSLLSRVLSYLINPDSKKEISDEVEAVIRKVVSIVEGKTKTSRVIKTKKWG